jgi:hypothetical protein
MHGNAMMTGGVLCASNNKKRLIQGSKQRRWLTPRSQKGSGNKEREKAGDYSFLFLKGANDYSWQSCREEAQQEGYVTTNNN